MYTGPYYFIMLHIHVHVAGNKKVLTVYALLVLARHNSHLVRNEMRGHRGNLLFQVVQ